MRRLASLVCALSIMLAPAALFADDAPATPAAPTKPVQFLTKKSPIGKGFVDTTGAYKEPAQVDWVTGKGRKDGVLEWAVDDNYLKKAPGMLGRGFSNTAFGWVDVVTQPIRWSKNSPLGTGTLIGLVMGPVVGTLRTTSGVVDLGTFWVPFWHGVPMKKPALGLHDVTNYGTIEDVAKYDRKVKRYGFNKLSDEY